MQCCTHSNGRHKCTKVKPVSSSDRSTRILQLELCEIVLPRVWAIRYAVLLVVQLIRPFASRLIVLGMADDKLLPIQDWTIFAPFIYLLADYLAYKEQLWLLLDVSFSPRWIMQGLLPTKLCLPVKSRVDFMPSP